MATDWQPTDSALRHFDPTSRDEPTRAPKLQGDDAEVGRSVADRRGAFEGLEPHLRDRPDRAVAVSSENVPPRPIVFELHGSLAMQPLT